jgi:hypothetical protein
MFTKEELKAHKTAFWQQFKTRMQNVRSSNGRKMNWINYPSEVEYIYVRLDADSKCARFMIDIQAKDEGIRAIIWEQLQELKAVMTSEMGSEGTWIEDAHSFHIPHFSRIEWILNGINFFEASDQEKIFDFLADRLICFDRFYQEFKDILINLAD